MRNLQFYKARSNLGIINKPFGGDLNFYDQVYFGPDVVLSSDFLARISSEKLYKFDFSNSLTLDKSKYFETVARESAAFRDLILNTTSRDDFRIVVGGDHSVSLGSVAASLKDFGSAEVGFIQIDSHLDLHLSKTSPSGNFHGMWLRALCSQFDNNLINSVSPVKLNQRNIVFIGNIIAESEEENFAGQNGIRIFRIPEVNYNLQNVLNHLNKMVNNFEHIHLSFDVDGVDDSLAPGTGIPAKNGLLTSHFLPMLEVIKKAKSLSLDLVEVNPKKDLGGRTIKLAQDIVLRIVS